MHKDIKLGLIIAIFFLGGFLLGQRFQKPQPVIIQACTQPLNQAQ